MRHARSSLFTSTFCLLAVSAACSDAERVMAPPTAPEAILYPVDDGSDPTYYEYDTTISGSGGLPGWSNPNERHSRTLKEIYQWSAATGYWNIDNRFATAEAPLGTSYPESSDIDVARGYKQRSSFSATVRNGSALSTSSFSFPLDRIPDGSGAVYNQSVPTPPLLSHQAAGSSGGPVDAPTFTPEAARTARGDRLVITEKGKDRELERLKATFADGRVLPDGDMEFQKGKADREVRVRFNPAIGAVTRVTVLVNGKKQIETTRRYKREDKFWVLAAIETEMYDDDGKRQSRFEQEIHDIQVQ